MLYAIIIVGIVVLIAAVLWFWAVLAIRESERMDELERHGRRLFFRRR